MGRLTQYQAADLLGLNRGTIQLYENGRSRIPLSVELACAALRAGFRAYGVLAPDAPPRSLAFLRGEMQRDLAMLEEPQSRRRRTRRRKDVPADGVAGAENCL
jgi:transcriptional regulator with XRE-family HTH domain